MYSLQQLQRCYLYAAILPMISFKYAAHLVFIFKGFSKCCLRQGVLSAYLFSFYVDSVSKEISNLPAGCVLGINKINILAYADDLVLMAPTSSALQILLDNIGLLLGQLNLCINVGKTVAMFFNKRKLL